jgi:hypothetical protein
MDATYRESIYVAQPNCRAQAWLQSQDPNLDGPDRSVKCGRPWRIRCLLAKIHFYTFEDTLFPMW